MKLTEPQRRARPEHRELDLFMTEDDCDPDEVSSITFPRHQNHAIQNKDSEASADGSTQIATEGDPATDSLPSSTEPEEGRDDFLERSHHEEGSAELSQSGRNLPENRDREASADHRRNHRDSKNRRPNQQRPSQDRASGPRSDRRRSGRHDGERTPNSESAPAGSESSPSSNSESRHSQGGNPSPRNPKPRPAGSGQNPQHRKQKQTQRTDSRVQSGRDNPSGETQKPSGDLAAGNQQRPHRDGRPPRRQDRNRRPQRSEQVNQQPTSQSDAPAVPPQPRTDQPTE